MKYVYFLIRTNPNMPVDKAKGFENNNPSDSLPALLMLIMVVRFQSQDNTKMHNEVVNRMIHVKFSGYV